MSAGEIAVLDWGVGGFGFFKLMTERFPATRMIYWSDSGELPYGKHSAPALARRLESIATHLAKDHGVTRLVIACNAASSVLPIMQDVAGVQVTGVILPALAELCELPRQRIGIIGGQRTIRSGIYGQALRGAGFNVLQRVAQPLSAFVEAGDLGSDDVVSALNTILRPMQKIDTLVLACTHYVALRPHFRRILPKAQLHDPAEATLAWVERHWQLASGRSEHLFLTTGAAEAMRRAAKLAFDVELSVVQTVRLP